MRKSFLLGLIVLLSAPALRAQTAGSIRHMQVDAGASTLAYTGHHFLHDWTGTNRSVSGTVEFDVEDPAQSRIYLSAPLEAFDSGNGNRDSNMLDVVESDRFPDVTFTSESITVETWEETPAGHRGRWLVRGVLDFHGVQQTMEVPVDVVVEGDSLTGMAVFPVTLSVHEVRRPKLMLKRISDTIDLEATIRAGV